MENYNQKLWDSFIDLEKCCLRRYILNTLLVNHFHNILRLFDVLPNFAYTTSKTTVDYYLETWYMQIA